MSSSLASPLPTIQALNSSISKLAETLDPLLSIPFSQLVKELESGSSQRQGSAQDAKGKGKAKETQSAEDDGIAKEKGNGAGVAEEKKDGEEEPSELAGMLDSARMRVSVAYVLLDLIWMYLKTKGIDPATHPVLGELERVKSYFGKIKAAQLVDQNEGRQSVDKTAADRFIRAALGSQLKQGFTQAEGVHKRFDFEEDEGSNSEDEDEEKGEKQAKGKKNKSKGKGKEESKVGEKRKERDETDETEGKKSEETSGMPEKKLGKKSRVVMDPFEGAVTGPPEITSSSPSDTPKSEKGGKKKKKRHSGGGKE